MEQRARLQLHLDLTAAQAQAEQDAHLSDEPSTPDRAPPSNSSHLSKQQRSGKEKTQKKAARGLSGAKASKNAHKEAPLASVWRASKSKSKNRRASRDRAASAGRKARTAELRRVPHPPEHVAGKSSTGKSAVSGSSAGGSQQAAAGVSRSSRVSARLAGRRGGRQSRPGSGVVSRVGSAKAGQRDSQFVRYFREFTEMLDEDASAMDKIVATLDNSMRATELQRLEVRLEKQRRMVDELQVKLAAREAAVVKGEAARAEYEAYVKECEQVTVDHEKELASLNEQVQKVEEKRTAVGKEAKILAHLADCVERDLEVLQKRFKDETRRREKLQHKLLRTQESTGVLEVQMREERTKVRAARAAVRAKENRKVEHLQRLLLSVEESIEFQSRNASLMPVEDSEKRLVRLAKSKAPEDDDALQP